MIIFVRGYSLSVICSGPHFYCVDYHSRDCQGRPSPAGSAVILKFSNNTELAKYVI